MNIDKGELKELIRTTAQEAIEQHARMVGIPEDPIEAQTERAAVREILKLVSDDEFRQDLMAIRKWRKTLESIQSKGIIAALGLLFLGSISFILYAFNIMPSK